MYNPNVPPSNYFQNYQSAGLNSPTGGYQSPQPEDGFAGITEGEKSKVDVGGIAQAGIGAVNLGIQSFGMANQSLGLNKSGQGYQVSAAGQPVYTGGGYANDVASARPQGASVGETLGMASQGAAAGSSFGLPGAIIGGAVGAITGLIGGGARRRAQEREKRRAIGIVRKQQGQFNEASQAFDQEQASMTDYRRRRDMTNRLYNLYSAPQTLGV